MKVYCKNCRYNFRWYNVDHDCVYGPSWGNECRNILNAKFEKKIKTDGIFYFIKFPEIDYHTNDFITKNHPNLNFQCEHFDNKTNKPMKGFWKLKYHDCKNDPLFFLKNRIISESEYKKILKLRRDIS